MATFVYPDRHRVAVLVRDGVLPMELGIVHQLFGQARHDWRRRPCQGAVFVDIGHMRYLEPLRCQPGQ